MSEVAAPGWARLTKRNLGSLRAPSRGSKKTQKRKILFLSSPAKGFAVRGKTFRKPAHGFCAMSCQIEGRSIGSSRMTQGPLWLFSAAQGLAMLVLNIGPRELVS